MKESKSSHFLFNLINENLIFYFVFRKIYYILYCRIYITSRWFEMTSITLSVSHVSVLNEEFWDLSLRSITIWPSPIMTFDLLVYLSRRSCIVSRPTCNPHRKVTGHVTGHPPDKRLLCLSFFVTKNELLWDRKSEHLLPQGPSPPPLILVSKDTYRWWPQK